MLEGFVDEARRRFTIAAFGAGCFGGDAPSGDVFWLKIKEFEESALAGMHLLNREIAAADARLVGQNEKGNAAGNELVDAVFDAGQEFDLIGVTDVIHVADQGAVAIGEDCEAGCGVCEAWVEPDVFQEVGSGK